MFIATILKIPKLQDYLVLAVVVRGLSKHQSAFLFDWIAPRIFHYISFALHFICITLHLHLKIMPRQHEMHDTSRFKCHALHLHFMK